MEAAGRQELDFCASGIDAPGRGGRPDCVALRRNGRARIVVKPGAIKITAKLTVMASSLVAVRRKQRPVRSWTSGLVRQFSSAVRRVIIAHLCEALRAAAPVPIVPLSRGATLAVLGAR